MSVSEAQPGSGSAVVVLAPRELDIATSNDLRRAVDEALLTSVWLVIDMSAVEFMDSTGISELVRAHNLASMRGGDSVLVGLSARGQSLLHLTQVDRVVRTYATVDDIPEPPW